MRQNSKVVLSGLSLIDTDLLNLLEDKGNGLYLYWYSFLRLGAEAQ